MLGFDNRTSEMLAECQKTIAYLQNRAAALEAAVAMSRRHGDVLQKVGTALGLMAGADLHRDLLPALHERLAAVSSGEFEAWFAASKLGPRRSVDDWTYQAAWEAWKAARSTSRQHTQD